MLESHQRNKIVEFLKSRAPFSVIEAGLQRASDGHVSECSKSGNTIHGIVKDEGEVTHTVSLDFVSSQETEGHCTCSTDEEMQEQWCQHAVALLWRSCDLGFLDASSGFVSSEAIHRTGLSSPQEIAGVIRDVSRSESAPQQQAQYSPKVSVVLDVSSDRLGVQVLFDGEPQVPTLFEGFKQYSSRALDNILLRLVDDEGSWDDDNKIWYINSSNGIETVLGLIQEYKKVVGVNGKKIEFAPQILEARLDIEWTPEGAELSVQWILPDGSTQLKESELIGTGPYWTCVDGTLFRISAHASRIASVFPHASRLTVSKTRLAPILEELRNNLFDPRYIHIANKELQPEAEVKTPQAVLELSRRETIGEEFSSNSSLEISAVLEFEYPLPPADSNIVYLPDRQKERDCIDLLKSLGFNASNDRRSFVASGDFALDVVHRGKELFPGDWRIDGLEALRKGIRFAELSINISIGAPEQANGSGRGKGKIDWFDCQVSLSQNNAHVPLSTLFKNARGSGERWVKLDSGAYAHVPGGGVSQLKTTLGMLDPNFRLTNTIRTRLSTAQAVSFSSIHDEHFTIDLDSKLKSLTKRLREFKSIEAVPLSKEFKGKLREYQHEGLNWLHFLHQFELGGILADEMGLGKTVQTLAFLQASKEEGGKASRKPALVVAPTSVITNWFYEAQRFTPKLSVLVLHGPRRKEDFAKIPQHDIVITSYALLRLDRYDLERHEFSYLILDEAQNIKNPETATTRAAKNLRARGRIALSGTPTENRPLELWSIMDFLMPGYLGSMDFFRNYIEKPILEGGPGVHVAKFLNSKTRPFILRRTKAEVEKDLPPKIESSQYVSMTASQAQLYSQILEEVRPRVFDAVNKLGIKGASVSILAALLRLRQVCNHPNSIDALKELPGYDSGKFNLLKDLVAEALESGKKVLLFSQFREMLAIIRRHLERTGVNYLYLDGATRNRQELIDRFNADTNVRLFLVSLKAGGTGLNLTAADTVIIYDPWWNPAVENQAVDRAHRIGQTKTVNVYRLITENSIEQKIMQLKAKKSKIVDVLINENGLSTTALTRDDLESLFSPLPKESMEAVPESAE